VAFRSPGLQHFRPEDAPHRTFKRNCWISFEPVEGSRSVLADYIDPDKIMWATADPNSDGFFPGRRRKPRTARAVVSRGAASGIGRAMGFYDLH